MLGNLQPVSRAMSSFKMLFDMRRASVFRRNRVKLAANVHPVVSNQSSTKQLLVDVSVIQKSDAGTGIQRVVRSLVRQLLDELPAGYEVRLVYATRFRSYCYAEHYLTTLNGIITVENIEENLVRVAAGDIFLGLDLAAHILPHHHRQLSSWKQQGVKFFPVVYDLLPALHPEWFTPKAAKAYRAWMQTVALFADGAICISKSVAMELSGHLKTQFGTLSPSLSIQWFHLGSNLNANNPSGGCTRDFESLQQSFQTRPSILMVGTIEPRKGYAQVLSAFELLWQKGFEVNLVIVGKAGWGVEKLVGCLRKHSEAGQRLFWLESVSDELLSELYTTISGVLMASEGEGFGLPIVEAAYYAKPVLARDLPVFREIGGVGISYFEATSGLALSEHLAKWIASIENSDTVSQVTIKQQGWDESAQQLLSCLGLALEGAAKPG